VPKLSRFFALPILAGAFAFSSWGQGGAFADGMSFYNTPSYDGVERSILNPKTNLWEVQRGWLMFDAKEQVRFLTKGGEKFRIPYKSIRSLEYSFYNPVPSASVSHSPVRVKLGGKRYLTVKFDTGAGAESMVLGLEPDQYQQVIGTFQAKTGTMALHPGGYEKHW
jgi:hypothetical protein